MRFDDATTAIFHGALSARAQGFLLTLPLGAVGRAGMQRAMEQAYGGLAHPDIFILEGEAGANAKIDDVRRALAFAHTHPSAKGLKTLWVPEADTMTEQAANAFLKTLEEPSASTRVILGASRPERLLATTRSRCLVVSVRNDAAFAQEELLERAPDTTPTQRQQALDLAGGAIDAAARLLLAKGGLAWASAADAALMANTLLPVPTTGAAGLDGPTIGLVIHTSLAKAMRAARPSIEAKIDAAIPFLSDLDRPGLDVATRTRALARAIHTA